MFQVWLLPGAPGGNAVPVVSKAVPRPPGYPEAAPSPGLGYSEIPNTHLGTVCFGTVPLSCTTVPPWMCFPEQLLALSGECLPVQSFTGVPWARSTPRAPGWLGPLGVLSPWSSLATSAAEELNPRAGLGPEGLSAMPWSLVTKIPHIGHLSLFRVLPPELSSWGGGWLVWAEGSSRARGSWTWKAEVRLSMGWQTQANPAMLAGELGADGHGPAIATNLRVLSVCVCLLGWLRFFRYVF